LLCEVVLDLEEVLLALLQGVPQELLQVREDLLQVVHLPIQVILKDLSSLAVILFGDHAFIIVIQVDHRPPIEEGVEVQQALEVARSLIGDEGSFLVDLFDLDHHLAEVVDGEVPVDQVHLALLRLRIQRMCGLLLELELIIQLLIPEILVDLDELGLGCLQDQVVPSLHFPEAFLFLQERVSFDLEERREVRESLQLELQVVGDGQVLPRPDMPEPVVLFPQNGASHERPLFLYFPAAVCEEE